MKKAFILLTIAIVISMPVSSRADTITLQNGRTLNGQIIGQPDDYIEIKLGSGKMKLSRKDIKSFEIKEPAEGYSNPDSKETAPGRTNAPATLSNINLKAEYAKSKIRITGKADLPRGTKLTLNFKRQDKVLITKRITVRSGDFFTLIEPFERQLSPGKYAIEARAEADNKEIAAGSCDLVVGSVSQVSEREKSDKQRLTETADRVQSLYNDLNTAYETNKKNFDKKKWDEWSASWLRMTNDQMRMFMDYSNGNVETLYPKVHGSLEVSFRQLVLLNTAYSMEFAAQKKPGEVGQGPTSMMLNPQFLKNSIDSTLADARKEINLTVTR
ncbi:MAG: hypothetical protein PHX64_01915 [Candidatus Omnitrophica bacterium]|nr:hypothetical protein [Candidatus Omnitrophota bacterium]MDD5546662.1 hypothetical protein [Candidatus Omnitrophota bacterium]